MSEVKIHECECADCRQGGDQSLDQPLKELHRQMNLFISRLDEQQRRWYVALESLKIGHGGDRLLFQISGMNVETIRRGRRELEASLEDRPTERVRLEGGGRPVVEKKTR